jgi:hypothetical protein
MKGNHHQAAAWAKRLHCCRQDLSECVKFVVDLYAQRLEGARRRMNRRVPPTTHSAFDHRCKFPGRQDRRPLTRANNGRGDPARLPLFAKRPEKSRHFLLRFVIHELGSGDSHTLFVTHIQRRIVPERETTLTFIELE